MISLNITLDGDGAWPDLPGKEIAIAEQLSVTALAGGMSSGAPSVTLRLDLPGGQVAIAETSLKLFLAAADAFKAKYGDPRE